MRDAWLAALTIAICAAASAATAETRTIAVPPPAAAGAASLPGPDGNQLSVTIDRAKVIRLPEGAKTVIVGNPGIADITVQKSGVVVVTGKSYGVTNLIALDTGGNMLAESTLSVRAPTDTVVVLQRGPTDRQSYSCSPVCLPSALLGDGSSYFNDNKSQIDRSVQAATPK